MLDYQDAIAPDEIEAASAVRRQLAHRVQHALAPRTHGSPPCVTRVSVAVDAIDPFAWLQAQPMTEQLYWRGRGAASAVAAVGAADVLMGRHPEPAGRALAHRLRARFRQMREAPSLRYYGGWAFDPAQSLDDGWAAFGTHRFVLPRFELHPTADGALLHCNLVAPDDTERLDVLLTAIDHLVMPAAKPPAELPPAVARTDQPGRAGWIDMVRWALGAIEAERLDKIVLARRTQFDFVDALSPSELLRRLYEATPNCFHFLFQPAASTAFLGASPERLFCRTDRRIRTEAVAGTRSRGDSAQADAALRDELMESEKDRREHAFVADAIRERLDALCTTVQQDGSTSELRLARGRHLRSQFEGTLREGITSLDVARTLHPTPAIGGVPTGEAVQAIREQEPFARGWYAGPVGWIGPDAAEFAVAIRSGLVRGNTLALYSGAGIVDGSVPEQEWDEIEQKIGDFAAVLDLSS